MKHFLLNYFNFKINKINPRDPLGGLVSKAPRFLMQADRGSIPDPGTRFHMLQLKIPHATAKTRYNQINKLN